MSEDPRRRKPFVATFQSRCINFPPGWRPTAPRENFLRPGEDIPIFEYRGDRVISYDIDDGERRQKEIAELCDEGYFVQAIHQKDEYVTVHLRFGCPCQAES